MKDEEPRNWADLPSDLMYLILLCLSVTDILDSAQKVCRPWRRVCKDPFMWRKINMVNLNNNENLDLLASMCRYAVDRSHGDLVEIHVWNFITNDLLDYITDRSSNLRTLGLGMCHPLMTNKGVMKAIAKLPLLETLEVSHTCFKLNLKAIGRACPQLKTLKLNCSGIGYNRPSRIMFNDDGVALAIAKNMPELCHLQLIENRLTDKGLNTILDGCPHLKHFELQKCSKLNIVGDLEKRCFERIENFRCLK